MQVTHSSDVALQVALYVRLYRLLADRPEFLTGDVGDLIDKAWTMSAGSLPILDRVSIARMEEIDRLCGYAVAKLRNEAHHSVLDLLGILDPSRIAGIYHALPAARQRAVLRDPYWRHHVGQFSEDAINEALAFWEDMPDGDISPDAPPDVQHGLFRFARGMQRLRAGLPHDLTTEEQQIAAPFESPQEAR